MLLSIYTLLSDILLPPDRCLMKKVKNGFVPIPLEDCRTQGVPSPPQPGNITTATYVSALIICLFLLLVSITWWLAWFRGETIKSITSAVQSCCTKKLALNNQSTHFSHHVIKILWFLYKPKTANMPSCNANNETNANGLCWSVFRFMACFLTCIISAKQKSRCLT